MKPFFSESDIERSMHLSKPKEVADHFNQLVKERAKVVYGHRMLGVCGENWIYGTEQNPPDAERSDTHQALLICVEPIEKDSADDLLKDLIAAYGKRNEPMGLPDLIERARKLLEKK